MAKYEIMVLVSGKLTQPEADAVNADLLKHIKAKDVESKHWGTRELAYPINGENTAHYYLITFDGGPQSFVDWRRLTLINKSVLRHLVVNLEKDYAWRVTQNAEKVKRAEIQRAKYDEITANPDFIPPRKPLPPPYKPKKRDEWTIVKKIGPNGPEDISQYFKKRERGPRPPRDGEGFAPRREGAFHSTREGGGDFGGESRGRRSASTRRAGTSPRRDGERRGGRRGRFDEGDE